MVFRSHSVIRGKTIHHMNNTAGGSSSVDDCDLRLGLEVNGQQAVLQDVDSCSAPAELLFIVSLGWTKPIFDQHS